MVAGLLGKDQAPRARHASSGTTPRVRQDRFSPPAAVRRGPMGGRYLSTFGIEEPSPYPASVRPRPNTRPPATCHTVNVRTGTPRAPAIGFRTVRTTGTKRASTIAFA